MIRQRLGCPSGDRRTYVVLSILSLLWLVQSVAAQPFTLQGPNVQSGDFEITTFAEGLNYPVGMAELSDGSLLVGVSEGSFFGSRSQLLRLADTDGDGVADEQNVLFENIGSAALSDVRIANGLVFAIGQKTPLQIFRLGELPDSPLSRVGEIDLRYPSGRWLHPHSALAAAPSAIGEDAVDVYFQVGSDTNFGVTTRTVRFQGFGIDEPMNGDSIYRVTISDDGNDLLASDLTQIATGLRNAAGMEFDANGNLYFQDNGIDGFVDANEPEGADELNVIAAADIGGEVVEDFGFPENYTQYRTNEFIGGGGIPPLAAFQPIGDPLTGDEGEGPNDIAFPPASFPDYLNNGVFVTMHGRFPLGGLANEENPLIFVNREDNSYFHLIGNDEPDVGHIDGLLTTEDSLYLADISITGGFSPAHNNKGAIYRVRSLVASSLLADANEDGIVDELDASLLCGALSEVSLEEALGEVGTVPGDFDLNGSVEFADFLILSDNFGLADMANYGLGDTDCNGAVEFADFLTLSSNFGHSRAASVPEPDCTWCLMLCFAMLLLRSFDSRAH